MTKPSSGKPKRRELHTKDRLKAYWIDRAARLEVELQDVIRQISKPRRLT